MFAHNFYKGEYNSFNKVTRCLSICMFVPKDLANCSTDMVLLYRVAFIGPGKVYYYFGRVYHHPTKRNRPKKKNINWKTKTKKFKLKNGFLN